jgi:hypothetical protein
MRKTKSGPILREAVTYKLGRKCLYCGEPIEDQARANKFHCSAWVDEYGKRHDCKRDRHALRHKLDDDVLLDISAGQREIKRQIERMITAHGDEVSTEVLIAYGIKLMDCLRFKYHSGLGTFDFLGYRIISNPKLKTHKIERYEQL